MERVNIDPLINEIKKCVDKHYLGRPGEYCRYLWQWGKDEKKLGLNEYGVADAANILYTIGYFPQDTAEREGFIKVLSDMQNPETGMYSEPTHHTFHTTAHCTAALELFDAHPLYKCKALAPYTEKDALYKLLEEGIRWEDQPWRDSHIGAGLLPSLDNTGMVDLKWKDDYFDWLWENTDSETGFIFHGKEKRAPMFHFMGGAFHYFFNHECEHRPMRYPEKVIDSCIDLMRECDPDVFFKHCGFIEVDVVYCLTRAMRQTPHRFFEAKKELEIFAEKFLKSMELDYEKDDYFNDLHCLFGSLCCLAELQSALPGKLVSTRPLRLVLDRRPFI